MRESETAATRHIAAHEGKSIGMQPLFLFREPRRVPGDDQRYGPPEEIARNV
jgi:hypothetical protein